MKQRETFWQQLGRGFRSLSNKFFNYLFKTRYSASLNRQRVGKNLTMLSIFLFFIFLINFVVIVVTDTKFGVELSKRAQSMYQREVTVQAKRGTIYDRDGNPIAEDSTTYSIYAILSKTYVTAKREKLYIQEHQFDKVAEILAQYLEIAPEDTLRQLQQEGLYQVSFGLAGSGISYSTKTAIEAAAAEAGITGLGFTTSPGRLYPNGVFASHMIGYAQLITNEEDGTQSLIGQTGLEQAMDATLAGQDGKILYEKDSKGNVVPGTGKVKKQVVDGKDVYTTLSPMMQNYLESAMDNFYGMYQGALATATLVSARTGEILATTQRPTYNPQTREGIGQVSWNTALYQGNNEPGSTMKILTVAAAIDIGVFNTDEYYYNDEFKVADATIRDWNVNAGRAPVYLNFPQALAFSSNIGMMRLQEKMGAAAWVNYISKFKFGFPTRFGMGTLNNPEDFGLITTDNEVSIATSTFGQGMSATLAQIFRAYSSISNNGVMLEPKFLSGTYDPATDSARLSQPEVVGNPVSAAAAAQTRQYMITVGTDPDFGTLYSEKEGAIIKVAGQNVAVKSGTAQIAAEAKDGGGYLQGENDYIYSVVAMTPAEDPDFLMYVTMQQPYLKSFDGLDWKYIFNPVLDEATKMRDALNLTSPTTILSKVENETPYAMPDVIGESPGHTADELRRNYVHPIVLGTGSQIKALSVPVGSNVRANQQILILSDEFLNLPDMYGWTKENVEQMAKWKGVKVKFVGGQGTVIAQSYETNTPLTEISKLTITLGE